MSVLIKDMKMLKNCYECLVRNQGFCGDGMKCGKTGSVLSWRDGHRKRMDNCPLVPVPPYGRLIDADSKTFPTLHRNPSNDYMKGWNACLRSVQQQPTIIPAEPAEEGQ